MSLFEDREDAAKQLVRRLEEELPYNEYNAKDKQQQQQQKSNNNNNNIILAIPRGGVVIGDVISNILDAKLDIIVSRKIGAPTNPELAIGAVMPDGSYFLNEDIVNMLNVPQSYIIEQANIQKKEIERRLRSFRGGTKEEEEEVLYSPELFGSVGQFYENFEQVSDDEVREIMKRHGYNPL